MEDGQLIAYLDRKFEDLRQEMNQRFEQVDQRFEQVDQRFEQVDQQFGGVEQRLGGLEQHLGGLEQHLGGLEQHLGGLEQHLGGLEQHLGGLEQRVGGVEQRLGGLEQSLGAVEGEVRGLHVLHEELSDRVKLVAEGVMGVEEKLDAFRDEMRKELREVRETHRQSYAVLDRRLRKVESIVIPP